MHIPYLTSRYNELTSGLYGKKPLEERSVIQKLSEGIVAKKENISKAFANATELVPLIDMGYSKEEVDRSFQSESDNRMRQYNSEINKIRQEFVSHKNEIDQYKSAIENESDLSARAVYEEKLLESQEKMNVFATEAADRLEFCIANNRFRIASDYYRHYGLPNRDSIKQKTNIDYDSLLPEDLEILLAQERKYIEENSVRPKALQDIFDMMSFSAESLWNDISNASTAAGSGFDKESEVGKKSNPNSIDIKV